MTHSLKAGLAIGVLCIGAAAAGYAARGGSDRKARSGPDPAVFGQRPPEPRTSDKTGLSSRDKAELRTLIRQELEHTKSAEQPASPESPTSVGNHEPEPAALEVMSNEEIERFDRATEFVHSAIARGSWTNEDKRQLSAEIQALPGSVQLEIIRPLIVAINRDQVRHLGSGPPF